MTKKETLKMAVIAGASNALKIKSESPRLTDGEVLKRVTKSINSIVENLDEEI